MTADSCSTASRTLGETIAGSASTVKSWLLLEQPGAWPRDALDSRHLSRDLVLELSRLANAARVRVVLIRRPGRPAPDAAGSVACYVAHARRHEPWIRRTDFADPTDVLAVDLPAIPRGEIPAGDWRDPGPVFCVCTHGRHDPCCAVRGRPVAATLAGAFPEATWEVSHIGGDRFAANVVCFPHSLYLGRVEPADAVGVGRAYTNGHIPLEFYRGRSCDAAPVQAADHVLRTELGLTAITATVPLSRHRDGDVDTVRFTVRSADDARAGLLTERIYAVRLRLEPADPPRVLTCHASVSTSPTRYVPISVATEAVP